MVARKAALCLSLFIPSFLGGQEAATFSARQGPAPQTPGTVEQKQVLTEADALRMAEQYSPLLKAGEAQIEGATAAITTARTYVNPEVNLLDGHQSIRLPTSVRGILQHYGVAQRIELPFQRRARIKVAEIGRESSEYGQAENRLAVRGAVKQSFYTVLRRKQELDLAQQNQRLVEDFRRRIAVQVSTGEAAKLELTRADAELATVRTQVRSAELQVVTAISGLRAVIGAASSTPIDPEGALNTPPQLPPMSELLKRVLAQHPAYAQARTEVQRAQAALSAEKTLRVPQPTALAEYEQQPDLRFYRVGFALPLPFFDRRQGPIREAAARVRQNAALVDQQRLELTSALETAYGQYQIASQQVQALESGALREAEAALAAAQAAYKFGERGIIDVLDAQRVLRGVRLDHVNAQFDRQAALIELEQLRAVDPQ
ncbi:MAG TPA: TolC family protein [Bryobacteraceae bacterium]